MMPNYSQQRAITFPYTATADGWIQCRIASKGDSAAIIIDGVSVYRLGQTISASNYVEIFFTTPIAKGQTVSADNSTGYFIPCMG